MSRSLLGGRVAGLRAVALLLPAAMALSLAAPAPALEVVTPTTTPVPVASEPTPGGAGEPELNPQVIPVPSIADVRDEVELRGSNWPASIPVVATVCGNAALNGSADCAPSGAASGRTSVTGTFVMRLRAVRPPKPCPCVIQVSSPVSTASVRQPFTLNGVGNAPPTATRTTRTAEAEVKLRGSSGLSAWFGGSTEREIVLRVRNTGSTPMQDPQVTTTIGKGEDPTRLVQVPPLGLIEPGQTAEVRVPVTLDAPAFGRYRVKSVFGDLDEPLTVAASTSTYPWALIVLVWLLLQIPLLGLYKRRPVLIESDDDPFAVPAAPLPTPIAPVGTSPLHPVPNGTPRPVPPGYQPVFGVSDLRAYLDPASTETAAPASVVAPRVVLGGVAPASGHRPSPPPA